MKLPESLQPKRLFAKPSKDRRGVALVTVLTVMALTTILVLTFFSLATSEHRASNVYSSGLQAQQVAEQAVNMVIAQIREATVRDSSEKTRVWSSQPGAIRTWLFNGQQGDAYKLYSDDMMKVGGSDWSTFSKDFDDLSSWSSRPDHFVDLNEPVIRGEKVYYPIVNPLASILPEWPQRLGNDSGGIEGFRFNDPDSLNKLNDPGPVGRKAAGIAGAEDHVAMPVRWLYQLADGTIGSLEDGGGGGASAEYRFKVISGSGTPSARNPMVARFAFWADDETAKLNINTHAGGLAWDVPKAGGEMDMAMGKYQPAQKEWQRYPGHPATTHLSPVLAPGVLDIVNDRDAMEMLFRVVPRVVGGGSESGTRIINTRDPKEMNGLVADTDPLFPTLDDMMYRARERSFYQALYPNEKPIPKRSDQLRDLHRFPKYDTATQKWTEVEPEELAEHLERTRFFVTANSRAPETNLFNKPRIAMWPIYNTNPGNSAEYNNYLTTFDQLIHFCASMGKNEGGDYPRFEYIFKRERSDSATYDFEEIPRNKQLVNYLVSLLSTSVPGYNSSFVEKFNKANGGSGGEESAVQLAAMIFDYIRSTNLHDDTLFEDFEEAFKTDNTSTKRTFTNPRDINEKGFGHKGHGQVTPIRLTASLGGSPIEGTGMGRFYTLSGADIHVACVGMPSPVENALYPGVTQYNRGVVEPPSGRLYSNLPPLPINVTKDPMTKPAWPEWLKQLEMTNPAEFEASFDDAQWNWTLAFLNPDYANAVLSDPQRRFDRSLITKERCEMMKLEGWQTPTNPNDDARLLQASFLFNMFCPSIGWGSINPDMEVHIRRNSGMTFQSAGGTVGFLGFEGRDAMKDNDLYIWASNWSKPHRQGGARSWGGLLSFGYMMSARQGLQEGAGNSRNVWYHLARMGSKGTLNGGMRCRLTPIDMGYYSIESALGSVGRDLGDNGASDVAQAYRYDLVTLPFKVDAGNKNVDFDGGDVTFEIYSGGDHTEGSSRKEGKQLVQTVELNFPRFSVSSPVMTPGWSGYINEFNALSHDSNNPVELASLTADPGNPKSTSLTKASHRPGTGRNAGSANPNINRGRMAHLVNHWDSGSTYIRAGDVVQSVAIPHGDARIAASLVTIGKNDGVFEPHRDYGKEMMAHSLTTSAGVPLTGYSPGQDKDYLIIPTLPGNDPYRGVVPLAFPGSRKSLEVQRYGDFDNGSGTMVDGPYINKPDEGNVHSLRTRFTQEVVDYWESRRNYGEFPYFSNPELAESGGPAYFSPNRIISGPGMLGSLPTSLRSKPPRPWQTLLFRPNVEGNNYERHPGGETPPDHLIMDLFWMPVVEPYAISEPLSTAGKVNLNFQILPFLHVHRDTALRGLFRSEFMVCIPNQWHHSYKHDRGRGRGYHWRDNPYGGALQGIRLRSVIVEDATLDQFLQKFSGGLDAFKSSSEICDIHLIPEEVAERLDKGGSKGRIGTINGPGVDKMANGEYWRAHSLVGDNSRERPYTNLQARLTTKSNTFQVHYRAQVIKQSRRDSDGEYSVWRPATDTVQAEYRGSSIVERYVDPNDEEVPDFATAVGESLDAHYRFRVINPRRFAP